MEASAMILCIIALTKVILTEPSINLSGDLEIIGMFEIHEKDSGNCGSQVKIASVTSAEAVKWYIQQLNLRANLFVNIGFRGLQTCGVETEASKHAINIMDQVLNNKIYIIGVVGPEFSSEAEVVSPILSIVPARYRLAQVGFSTTAAVLDDDVKYPNFIRVIPDDAVQIEAMIQSMLQLKWNRVAVIYENNTYGQDAFKRLEERAKLESICISLSRAIAFESGVDSLEITAILNDIIVGTGSRPSINGVVFIGEPTIASAMFLALKNSIFSTIPIVMLSESFNMDPTIFKEVDGQVIAKSKGTLALSPPYVEVKEFQTHWKTIFTNDTTFQTESATNPWLLDVYYEVTKCTAKNCAFKPMPETTFNTAFERQPLYIQYAIKAAHALVKAATYVHSRYCSGTGLCNTFRENFRPAEVLDALKGMTIDWKVDFSFRLESLANQSNIENISKFGELQLEGTVSKYQLYNFRTLASNLSAFGLVKVGDFSDKRIDISFNDIRDYTLQGSEKLWPALRIPQCLEQSRCSECFSLTKLYEGVVYDPGDLYIVGIVPIFDSSGTAGCGDIRTISGYQTAEAIRLAVQKVNSKTGDYAGMFQGSKVGVVILNSCNNAVVVQRKLHNLLTYGLDLRNGTVINLENRILGFVGDLRSSLSIAVAEVLTRFQFAQISFSSTSPALSDRIKYPYFLRDVTPDDAQAKAIIKIIKQLKADYVQLVYSVGAYGEGGRDKIRESARENQICVINEILVEDNGNPYEIYENLRKYKYARIVIIFLHNPILLTVLSVLADQMEKGEFIFIGSEEWGKIPDPIDGDSKHILLGSITLSLEMYQDNELKEYIQSLNPLPLTTNPWVTFYLQAKRQCYFEESFDKTQSKACPKEVTVSDLPLGSWDTSAFVAARSLLIGANSFLQQKCGKSVKVLCSGFTGNTKGLVEEILKTKLDLDGSGNKIKVFNTNGDGNIGYRIYNIQKDDDPKKLMYKEVGRFPLEGTFTFETDQIVRPLEDKEILSVCPNEQACSGCIQKQNKTVPSGETGAEAKIIGLSVALSLACFIIIVIAAVFCLWWRKYKAEEIYLHPHVSNEVMMSYRQEAVGSECLPPAPRCYDNTINMSTISTTDQ